MWNGPSPTSQTITCSDTPQAVERLARIANSRWEAEALEWYPPWLAIHVRLGGPPGEEEPSQESLNPRVYFAASGVRS